MKFEFFAGKTSENETLKTLIANLQTPEIKDLKCTKLDVTNVTADDFKLEIHQTVWNYWQKLRGDEEIAIYDTIDPIDLNRAIGYILLLEPNEDLTDFRYRVYGSTIAERFGAEMTGKWVTEFKGGQKELSICQYSLVLSRKWPIYSEHYTSIRDFKRTKWCRLILPMQHQSGAINRILVANVPKDQEFDLV
ncbi:PAS domain-containing protein [Sneathiella limimaris]|uniref:PAS domain-containing protein n=1 Tax=Sneathiella limimaris TaxID=1964213 RepID=UPI001469FD47|nr:PAS domain-containing protein [Sneathiella limimaris]